MNNDQALGVLIFASCLMVSVGYVGFVAVPEVVKSFLPWLPWSASEIRFGAIAAAVLVAFVAVMLIGAWVGWTMATTPPPKPIEELESEGQESNASEKKNS